MFTDECFKELFPFFYLAQRNSLSVFENEFPSLCAKTKRHNFHLVIRGKVIYVTFLISSKYLRAIKSVINAHKHSRNVLPNIMSIIIFRLLFSDYTFNES